MNRPRRLARPARIAALACLSLTGCAWSQPPQARDALIAPAEIKRPLSAAPQGQLMMLPEGDWALVHDPRSAEEPQAMPPGAVVITSRGEGAQVNLYGVRVQRSWGVVLQRLDGRRVAPGTTHQLATLATDSRALASHGVCAGSDDLRANACIQAAPPGTRFSVYALDTSGALAGLSDKREGYLGQAPRAALAQRGFDDVTIYHDGAALPKRWLAITHPQARPRVARAAVALDPACPALSAPNGAQLRVVRAPVASADNPVSVEQLSLRLGVDAAMRCEGDEVVAMTPTWWRAPLRDPWTGQSQGPGALGMLPLRARGLSDAQRGLLAASQAAHATGDVELAAFWLERLLATLAASSSHDELALQSAQALALGGRPELALHVAAAATRARWNRTEDLLYTLTREAVYRGLGLERESLKVQGKAAALAAADPRRVSSGWYVWQQALRQGVKRVFSSPTRQTEQTSAFSDPDAKLWVLSLFDEWLLPPHQPDEHFNAMEREALRERHQALDLLALWDALSAPPAPSSADGATSLDSYGRGLRALPEDARWEAIAQVAPLRVQPSWLDALAHSDDPLWRAALVMTSSSLALDEASISALGEALAGAGCARAQALSRIAHDALLRRRASAPGAFADAQEGALWVMEHGLTRACQDMDTLWAAVEALPPRDRALVAPHAAALFEGWLRGGAGATHQRVALLERAMRASAQGPRCATWGLALALAALRDGELERARAGATRALNCGGEDAAARRPDGELLLAMIGYEMSGQYVGAGSDEALAARLRAAAAPDPALAWCPGLQDDRPLLQRAMPKALWRLSSGLSVSLHTREAQDSASKNASPKPREGGELMGSSAVIALAMEDLAQARQALERGDLPTTSAALERARAALAQAGHHAEARRADAILRGLFARDEQSLNGPLIAPAPWAAQLAQPGGAAAAQDALLARPKLSAPEAALLTSLTLLRSAPDAWRALRERQDVAPAWDAICD